MESVLIEDQLRWFRDVAVERVLSAAVYWHGAAGDVAAAQIGEVPLIATDLLDAMPEALRAASALSKSEGGVA